MKCGLQKYNAGTKMNQWSRRVATCRNSGMTVKAWCAQEGLSEKTYYYWQRKIFKATQSQMAEFVEITGSIPTGKTVVATVIVNGYSIEIRNGADTETLRESGVFQWPRTGEEAREITPQLYRWLMEGLSIEQPRAHKEVTGITMI